MSRTPERLRPYAILTGWWREAARQSRAPRQILGPYAVGSSHEVLERRDRNRRSPDHMSGREVDLLEQLPRIAATQVTEPLNAGRLEASDYALAAHGDGKEPTTLLLADHAAAPKR